jgi:hypothetical protein
MADIEEVVRRLKRALNALDNAKSSLEELELEGDAAGSVEDAVSELDDVETEIRRALREAQ